MKQTLHFSPITEKDLPAIQLLQPEFWADIIPAFQWYLTLDFAYLAKVELDNEVVGTGVALVHADSVWLANIIVGKDHRNKGIGSAITEHLIAYAQKITPNILLIATKLGRPFMNDMDLNRNRDMYFSNRTKLPYLFPRILFHTKKNTNMIS